MDRKQGERGAMSRKSILGAAFTLVIGAGLAAWAQAQTAAGEEAPAQPYTVPLTIAAVPAPTQPIPYSHKTHAGDLGLDCQFCHQGQALAGTTSGVMMTFPQTDTCMTCHVGIATDKESIIRLSEYHATKQPVPWQRVYTIVKGVNWSHRTHLEAGAQCETCHGDVRGLEVMAQTTVVAAMSSCIACHQARGATTDCQTCHAWPTEQQMLGWSN